MATGDASDAGRDPGNDGQDPSRDEAGLRLRGQVELILANMDGAEVYPLDRPEEMQYLFRAGRILS